MEQVIKILFSPTAFAVGFVWPLVAQTLIATNTIGTGWQVWMIAALIVTPFAASAQLRGSWIWIR